MGAKLTKYPKNHSYKIKCIDCHFRSSTNDEHICYSINDHPTITQLHRTCVDWRRRITNDLEEENKIE